jgi:hypothetical protein
VRPQIQRWSQGQHQSAWVQSERLVLDRCRVTMGPADGPDVRILSNLSITHKNRMINIVHYLGFKGFQIRAFPLFFENTFLGW